MDDFLWRALVAGTGVALVAGPLGSFVVWRRMAYFGDTLAHAALLGIALGLLLELPLQTSIMAFCLLLAIALVLLQKQRRLASDTLLGILSHTTLALGLIVISLMESVRVDLMGLLFGEILAVSQTDLYWVYGCDLVAVLALVIFWRPLLAISVDEELAAIDGVPVGWVRLGLMSLIAMVIALGMKVVGILLITSLLIIPAATARLFSRTPEQMALAATVIGTLAVGGGLAASMHWDLPAGPAIVCSAASMFFLVMSMRRS